METLTITDLDETILTSLKRVAKAKGNSVEQEAASLIRVGLEQSGTLTRRERAEAIAAMTPSGVTQTDSTLLIREDRDR